MQENLQQDEISLIYIFKTLLKKWLVLLITLIVGVVVGVGIAFIKNVNKNYYGTTITYYVNPVMEGSEADIPVYGAYGENITNSMVTLLNSELFADQILSGMDNPPEKYTDGKINPEYEKLLKKILSSVSFSNKSNTDENQPNNVFYAKISVLNDENFANVLLGRLQEETVKFIEKNMVNPDVNKFSGTKCTKITVVDNIYKTNSGEMRSAIIKYGLLLGAASFFVACVVIVFVDRQKQTSVSAEEV